MATESDDDSASLKVVDEDVSASSSDVASLCDESLSEPISGLQPAPASELRGHVIVAIDIGTAFSGYAMSFSRDKHNIYAMYATDPCRPAEGGRSQTKVPTNLLLKPDATFHSFGYQALTHYNRDLEEDEQAEWYCFERFKMNLHSKKDLSRQTQIAAANGRELPIGTVFAHVLRYFRDKALEECNIESEAEIRDEDVEWVITVPAIWSNAAKQMMREAAYEAGLASESKPDKVRIALEPESASLYCKSLKHHIGAGKDEQAVSSVFQPGKRYVLADLGGGTADIAVHEILSDGSAKELHCATGGAWGGTYVDKNFIKLLEKIFGQKTMDDYRNKYPGDWIDLVSVKFETSKRMALPETTTYVEFPFSFHTFLQQREKDVQSCVDAYGNSNVKAPRGTLAIKHAEVAKLFDPVLNNISAHLKGVLDAVGPVDYLILVGGFATCQILQTRFRTEFEKPYNLRVIVPRQSSLAVVMGAVLFGHDPAEISARRARYSYGVECADPTEPVPETSPRRTEFPAEMRRSGGLIFDHSSEVADSMLTVRHVRLGRHDDSEEATGGSFFGRGRGRSSLDLDPTIIASPDTSSLFERKVRSGSRKTSGCFATFVNKNQEVGVDEVITHPFMPFYSHQTEAIIAVYESDHEETRRVGERGVQKVTEMHLPMPNSHLGQDRVIEVSMKFGSTEITFSSLDKSSGKTVEKSLKLDFLMSD